MNLDVLDAEGHTTDAENELHISPFFSPYTKETTFSSFFYRWRREEAACVFILSLIISSL